MDFTDGTGKVFTVAEIAALITKAYDYTVYVGSDSQVHRKKRAVLYATCIVLYKQGKGGAIYVNKTWEPYPNSLRQRLSNETWRSIETSFALAPHLPKNAEIVIHVDTNKSKKFKSGNHTEELVGMVVGQGFKYRIKPDAWAAQCVANRFSK